MDLILLILASACFASGGLLMKLSDGATRIPHTAAFLVLFAVGAVLQAMAMRRADLGVAYIAVLGFEAVLVAGFSILFLHERWSAERIVAALLIVGGVILLRRS